MSEDIAKWVEALRSGEYKQTQGFLEKEGSYCCLGVYCEVTGIPYSKSVRDKFGVYQEDNVEVYNRIRLSIGECVTDRGIDMNDSGSSFAEIADMIEKGEDNA